MAIFGLKVEDSKEVDKFIAIMDKKLAKPDLFQNPFTGFIKKMGGDDPFIFVYLKLIWLNPKYISLMLTAVVVILNNFKLHWTLLLTLPLWGGAYMFTNHFSKLAIRHTLRRSGYSGSIKSLSDTELLLRFASWNGK